MRDRGDKGYLACASGGEWPAPPASEAVTLYEAILKNLAMYDIAASLALLGRILGNA